MDYISLEARMRPRRASREGFLGPTESLEQILREDAETVRRLGLTHGQIADKIEYLINPGGVPDTDGWENVDGIWRIYKV